MNLTTDDFLQIKSFILHYGDRKTYCNMYNHNPHYQFVKFDVYLHPDTGQRNINCEPHLSDFNKLVIQDFNSPEIYFDIKLSDGRLVFDQEYQAKLASYFTVILQEIKQFQVENTIVADHSPFNRAMGGKRS